MPRMKNNGPVTLFNGFINLYKPPGITSMEALRRVKRIIGQRNKVGHGGTMDPLAQGVLPVCLGPGDPTDGVCGWRLKKGTGWKSSLA